MTGQTKLNKNRILAFILIFFGILLAVFFGMRTFRVFHLIRELGFGPGHRPPPPSQTDVSLIRDWMTIPYIAMTYGVPDHMLFNELRIPEANNRNKSLKDLNKAYYPSDEGYVLEQVKQAILFHRPPQPPSTPTP